MGEISAIKLPLEEVSDKCELLMEFNASPSVRDSTAQLQSQYGELLSAVQVNKMPH